MSRDSAISTIRFLSLCLRSFPTAEDNRTPSRPSHAAVAKQDIPELSLFLHLSTMLNTGRPDSHSVAITGQMTAESLNATIVTSSNSKDQLTSDFLIDDITPSNMSSGVLEEPSALNQHDGPLFERHLSDVAGVLRLLSSSRARDVPPHVLAFWLVVQCRHKIKLRFHIGTKHWSASPWVTMVDWKPASDDVFESSRIEIPSPHRKTLADYGLPLEGSECPLNTNTVQQWINSLGSLLATAQAMCQKADRQSLKMLTNCLTTINYMLECPEIQKVLVETTSLSAVFDRSAISPSSPKYSRARNAEEAGAEANVDASDEELDILPEPGESAGGHVLRYLRTLTAWHAAARAAIQFLCKARKAPQVSLVKLSDHSPAALEDIRRNGQAVVDSLQRQIASKYGNNPHTMKDVSDWVQDYCRIPEATDDKSGRPFRIHPEAGLMALLMAGKTQSEGIPDNVYALATMGRCAIGASTKCCYMCHLLREYMFDGDLESAESVHLPSSHGYVSPWDPPSFGVPEEVLKKLATRLEAETLRIAALHASVKKSPSGESPPTSASDEEEIEWGYWE